MMTPEEEIELRLLLEAIYLRYQYDFRGYSLASVQRRLKLAKDKFGCRSYSALQEVVLRDPQFFTELLGYLTVQVSEMFRDPAYYLAIRQRVVPYLKTYPSLKVWIAGCSAGEELYSMAILFREEGLESRTMFYATDINTAALRKAQMGIYPVEHVATYSQNYQLAGGKGSLSDYYTAAYGSVVLDKSLQERTVFSDHSLVTDSVFAEMHLISCRNVLIYFERELQDRVIHLFEDSLTYGGFLGLGSKESLRLSSRAEAFVPFEQEARIYQKRREG